MLIADAQIHIWGPNTPERPWPTGVQVKPQRAIPISAAELLDTMNEVGVDRVVLVPPSWEGLRNDLVIAAAEAHPDRFASMGRLDLHQPRSLEDWRAQPGVLGVRTLFLLPVQRPWLSDGTADWLWDEAEKYDIPIMSFAPGQSELFGEIARRHPGMRLIIDHCNLSLEDFDDKIGPTIEPLLALSEIENIAVKISSLPSHVHEEYPFSSLHAPIKALIDAFGVERCMWGSDLSRLPCPYADWKELFVSDELGFLSEADKAAFMGETLCSWLKWPID